MHDGHEPPQTDSRTALAMAAALLTLVFGGLEYAVVGDLLSLERGEVREVRVWSLVAGAYEMLGFNGGVAVIPLLWLVAMVAIAYRAWMAGIPPGSHRATRIEENARRLGDVAKGLLMIVLASLVAGFGGWIVWRVGHGLVTGSDPLSPFLLIPGGLLILLGGIVGYPAVSLFRRSDR